jgi:hypothetical protein
VVIPDDKAGYANSIETKHIISKIDEGRNL